MAENQHIYAAIDLKSFYASVECVSRKLDTLTTNLVVADVTRSEKTICLAVSPSLKACGIPGRPRLFEVVQKVREVNRQRLADAVRAHKAVRGADGKWSFASSSFDAAALQKDLSLETHPRMGRLERAAQFSPFAALTGYDDAVRETARLTDAQRELAEDEQALLERQLLRVQMLLDAGTPPVVAVTWFQPDAKKQGGAYVTAKGKVRKIDEFGGALLLVGGEKIPISAVIGIQLYNDKEQIEEG